MSERVNGNGSPGSHPLLNWRPGDDDADDLLQQKIADTLRDGKSERHLAKLLDVSRSVFWRSKKLNTIPDGLLERLFDARVGSKALLYIARLCESGKLPPVEVEHCPNCGHTLRVRSVKGIRRALDVLTKWIEDGEPQASPVDSEDDQGGHDPQKAP